MRLPLACGCILRQQMRSAAVARHAPFPERCVVPRSPLAQVLSAHVLAECAKGPSSFWHPYLRSLPRSYTTSMCCGEEQAAALQVPHAVATARTSGIAASELHGSALPLLRALGLPPR